VGIQTRKAVRALACATALAVALVACGGHVAGASMRAPSATTMSTPATAASVPSGDWMEFDYDAQRSGVGPADTGIDAGNLGSLQTRVLGISGVADSSAVELHGVSLDGRVRDVIFITTTYGKTLAIDPATGTILWQFTPRDIGSYDGSAQITTATPIIDPSGTYLYAASPDGRIHKLDIANGAEVRSGHWPVRITFDATKEKIGTALNISGPWVIATTGGYDGDGPIYEGHVVVIDRDTGQIAGAWNAECSDRHHLLDPPSSCHADTTFGGSAIWARAGAVVEPNGRLLVATGNGPFNGSTNWGDSVLELSADAGRLLHNWTPRDQAQLNTSDTDLGGTAPALLPQIGGYRLAVQGGKDGMLHLLNLNRLDGTKGGAGPRTGGAVENVGSPGGGEVLTAPAVWSHDGRAYVFVGDDPGTAAYVLHIGRHIRLLTAWQHGTSGTSPVVAGGLLYVYDDQRGRLDIYAPASGRLLRSLPAAPGHWSSPIVIGGRIILPTGDNASRSKLFIYHLPGL
jgi:outer membrane protein assembly factor BamB